MNDRNVNVIGIGILESEETLKQNQFLKTRMAQEISHIQKKLSIFK